MANQKQFGDNSHLCECRFVVLLTVNPQWLNLHCFATFPTVLIGLVRVEQQFPLRKRRILAYNMTKSQIGAVNWLTTNLNVWRECECKRTIVTTPKEIAHKKKISFEKPDDLQPCKLNISKASQRQCTYPIPNYISFSERRSITAVFIYFFIKNCHISLLESNVLS